MAINMFTKLMLSADNKRAKMWLKTDNLNTKFTTQALTKIEKLSLKKPMTTNILNQIIILSDDIIVSEESQYNQILEGVMLQLDKLK